LDEILKHGGDVNETVEGPIRAYRLTTEEREPVTARARGTGQEK
jgi:hypothetical protein